MRSRIRVPSVSTLPVLVIFLGAGAPAAYYASRASQWAVMTDELQTSKLATSIGRSFSPVPQIHGEYYGAFNQLYPLVLSPLYGLLPPPAAFGAAHVLNAFLLASSAWPAYLLARSVTESVVGGYLAAALTVLVPWLVLSSTLLTENVAYPAFVWGVLLAYRTLVQPSLGRDAGALAGLALVYFARTQLFVLALALPVAVLGHELGFAAATAGRRRRTTALRDAMTRTVAGHRLLTAAYGFAAAGAAVLAALDSLTRLFGTYQGALQGNLFPAGVWHAAAVHLDSVVVGVGVAPFVLAAAWSLATVCAPLRREGHAFALLSLVLAPLLTFEAASFDLRFTPGRFVQDRYLSYLVPLLAVGAAACLLERRHRALRAALVLALGLAFPWLAGVASYGSGTVLYWASPAGAFQGALGDAASVVGLSADSLVRWGGLVLAVASAAALWRSSRVTLALVGVAVTAFGAFEAAYVFDRFALEVTTRPQTIEGVRRDWIDAAAPGGASVALVPNPEIRREYWWDAEFWNNTVDRVLQVDGRQTFTPFPVSRLSFDPETGQADGAPPSDLLVLDSAETRFRLAGTVTLAAARPLRLVRAARPYRAAWLVDGAEPDGWTRPGEPVQFRLFAGRRSARRELVLSLRAWSGATRPRRFEVRSGGFARRGLVPRGRVVRVRLAVCVPAGAFGSATLVTRGGERLPDGRVVSLHVDRIQTWPGRPPGGGCGVSRA